MPSEEVTYTYTRGVGWVPLPVNGKFYICDFTDVTGTTYKVYERMVYDTYFVFEPYE